MYFKNKIKENKVTEPESFKAVSSSYKPYSPKQTQGYKIQEWFLKALSFQKKENL